MFAVRVVTDKVFGRSGGFGFFRYDIEEDDTKYKERMDDKVCIYIYLF